MICKFILSFITIMTLRRVRPCKWELGRMMKTTVGSHQVQMHSAFLSHRSIKGTEAITTLNDATVATVSRHNVYTGGK